MVHDLSRVASHNEKNNGYYVVGLDVPKDLCVPLVIVSFILATISPLAFPADGTNNMVVGLQGEIHAAPVEDIVSIQANPSPLFQTILGLESSEDRNPCQNLVTIGSFPLRRRVRPGLARRSTLVCPADFRGRAIPIRRNLFRGLFARIMPGQRGRRSRRAHQKHHDAAVGPRCDGLGPLPIAALCWFAAEVCSDRSRVHGSSRHGHHSASSTATGGSGAVVAVVNGRDPREQKMSQVAGIDLKHRSSPLLRFARSLLIPSSFPLFL
jgi:hypothetical protein